MAKIDYLGNRICLATFCGFFAYLFLAESPTWGLSSSVANILSISGRVCVGIAVIQVIGASALLFTQANRSKVGIILNLVSILPIVYYFYIFAPQGAI